MILAIVDITPEMAGGLLARQRNAQEINQVAVESIVAAMPNTVWNQPIVVDDATRLVDGRHRCAAIVKAGITRASIVVRSEEIGEISDAIAQMVSNSEVVE